MNDEDQEPKEEIEHESVVIPFPKKFKTPNPKQAFENLSALREEEIEIVVDMICSALIETLESAGFLIDEETVTKELCFTLESVRALISKYYKIDHSFHELARHCFQVVDEKLVFINPKFERKIEIESKD